MMQLLVIGCGGAVGALMRYVLGFRITLLAGNSFPWGTLFVNIVGCFLAGLLLTLFVTRIPLSELLKNGI
ncbi:MAG: CrcB family protein, partial [Pseudomonadota bacterium]|nr:CrcB family protein [Pseudomonadota bacterium]